MLFRTLADLVALIHLAFVVFVLFGGLLTLHWHWMPLAHLPAAVWGAMVSLFGWYCPLTPLENYLRRAAGGGEYAGGFVEHYLLPLIYPTSLTRGGQMVLGALVLAINVGIYTWVWHALRR